MGLSLGIDSEQVKQNKQGASSVRSLQTLCCGLCKLGIWRFLVANRALKTLDSISQEHLSVCALERKEYRSDYTILSPFEVLIVR